MFCLVAGPAVAQPAYTPEQLAVAFAKGWRPLQPPPEYAGPYEGVLTVIGVPLAEIPEKCQQTPRVLGCASLGPTTLLWCTIYIPIDVVGELREAIYEHELGHCHGWGHPYPKPPEVKLEIDRGIAVNRALKNPVLPATTKAGSLPMKMARKKRPIPSGAVPDICRWRSTHLS